jgi:peroxiredoxin
MRFATLGLSLFAAVALLNLANADDTKLSIGDAAPSFSASSLDGSEVTLDNFKDADVVVLVFTCNGCPVAQAYEDRLMELAKTYQDEKVKLVAINNHFGEDIEAMKKHSEDRGFNFVYVYDGSGKSAEAYGAKVTPHCFVLDRDRKVVYQGGFDDSQKEPTKHYVADAVEATLHGKEIPVTTTKAFGCSIKLKKQ